MHESDDSFMRFLLANVTVIDSFSLLLTLFVSSEPLQMDYRCLAGFIMVMFGVILIRYKVVGNVINGMVLALTQQIVVPDINRYKM